MSGQAPQVEVVDEPARSRYELRVDGELVGLIDYRERDAVRVFVHTEVDPGRGGSGLGSTLVRSALDDLRERGLRVVPSCPFVAAFIGRHPGYADLLALPAGS